MDAEQTREEYPRAASGWETYHGNPPTKKTITTQNGTQAITPPSTVGEWTLDQIIKALSRPLPDSLTDTRRQGGANLKYIPWHNVNKVLDKYAPGWNWSIQKVELSADRLFIVGRLSIPTSEGLVYREATGTELLKETKIIKDPATKEPMMEDWGKPLKEFVELAYGDPSSNAESMAFRRAAARFGLGLYLYDK
jgi:hypothetical protein